MVCITTLSVYQTLLELPDNWFVVQQKRTDDFNKYLLDEISRGERIITKYRTNITEYDDEKYIYLVREFKLGQKLFPLFNFRIRTRTTSCKFSTINRYLYETYTQHISQDVTMCTTHHQVG